ncbi:MAG TPA: AMP-binding protein [Candidatus Sulfotelmatobacter sp.]|nr:AMP-binding protein [Candidatus Sulfotelmatobacter sp.]
MSQPYQVGDVTETCRTFRLDVPERYNWAYDVFDGWGRDPRKAAMLWVGAGGAPREVTFRELGERSRRVANALAGLGATPGDRVFIMLPRLVEWWELILGCIRARLVSVPGTTLLTPKDIAYRINTSAATIAVTDAEGVEKVEAARADCPGLRHLMVVGSAPGWRGYEDLLRSASATLAHPQNPSGAPLMIYFTSGTTGYPKMVLHTHASYPIGHLITGKLWLDNRPTDLHWTLSDTGWAQAAWTCLFGPWNMGATLFIWDQRGKFEPAGTLRMLETYPITTFFAPPTAYRMLVLEDLKRCRPKALRHCVGAGEPVNPEVIDAWRDGMGHQIWEGYGQTETVLCVATFPGMRYKPGSMGVGAPGFHMAVVDEQGHELPPGREGEVGIRVRPERPVGLFPGYWQNPEANARCFRGDWYYTGDRASRDEDGYFWFIGRADDVIISASYRIGPFEVESALLEHPAVAEAAVVGSPDEMRGEIVKAFVVLAPGHRPSDALAAELQEHVRRVTAPYKYPREVEFLADLPKTISGKIRRTELRARELERKGRGAHK